MKLNIRVHDILEQKISSIQSRMPIPLKRSTPSASFSQILEKTLEPTINREFQLDTQKKNPSSVSRNNSARYPRLPAPEIAALMPRINEAILSASQKYNIDETMIRAIIQQESSFQPYAVSTSGAMGLMQLMPDTARWLSVSDPFHIEQNIMGGTLYFRDQLNAFNGDLERALAAYNAGPNNVIKYNGIPPFSETQDYVKKVLHYYRKYTE